MSTGCNIWMIFLKLNRFFYGLSRMLQFSQFVWTPCYSLWDVFNNFLLIDAKDRSKISSDQKRFFIELSLYPLSFFANTPFKEHKKYTWKPRTNDRTKKGVVWWNICKLWRHLWCRRKNGGAPSPTHQNCFILK